MAEAKNTMTIGADGTVMHTLHASKGGKVTLRYLKTSPINSALNLMYVAQTTSSALHGQNILTTANPASGDLYTGQQAAFAKQPTNVWAEEANMIEWVFDVGVIDAVIGSGSPTI